VRITVIGHSTIALRQRLFLEELSKHANVLVISPRRWFRHEASYYEKGDSYIFRPFDVNYMGRMACYLFPEGVYKFIKEFEPDIIYAMCEWWQWQAMRTYKWAKMLKVPIVFFFWENILRPASRRVRRMIENTDLIIAGNDDCKRIIEQFNPRVVKLPQVGVDTGLFRRMSNVEKTGEVVFAGRRHEQKGFDIVQKLPFKVVMPEDTPYQDMPAVFNQALVHIAPSRTTPTWKEQFNYTVAESLACELSNVISSSGSMPEWFSEAPGVTVVEEGDVNGFSEAVKAYLDDWKPNSHGREWVVKSLSNPVIAEKLVNAFKELVT